MDETTSTEKRGLLGLLSSRLRLRRAKVIRSQTQSSTSQGNHSEDSSSSKNKAIGNQRSKAVSVSRVVFVIILLCFAALLGFVSHLVLKDTESDLSEAQFEAIAERALAEAVSSARRKLLATATLASTVGQLLPDAEEWPFVYVKNYDVVSRNVLQLASPESAVAFMPLVLPEQALKFENMAYDYYFKERSPPFPNGTGFTANQGFGIWREEVPEGLEGNYDVFEVERVLDRDGVTNWGSPYKILTPMFQFSGPPYPLMFNTHSTDVQGGYQADSIINCTRRLFETPTDESQVAQNGDHRCSALTEVFDLWAAGRGPESAIMSPIFPAQNQTTLTGFIGTLIVWADVLEKVFAETLKGIDCILETTTQTFTYTVVNGVAHYRGVGDLHHDSSKFNQYRTSVSLVESGMFTDNTPLYTLTVYPNEDFYDVYSTNNPWIAAIGAVAIFLFTGLLFLLYDYLVGREVRANHALLAAKRHFMRFVSHEVRTPLNSVVMGLELVRKEMAECLGFESIAALSSHIRSATKREGEVATLNMDSADKSCENSESPNKTVACQDAIEWFDLTGEIAEHTQSAVAVLTDLLNFDKMETGNLSLELQPLLIFPLISAVADEFRLSAANKELEYDMLFTTKRGNEESPECFHSLDELPRFVRNQHVIGDSVRLSQCLRNFISNAIKFSKPSGFVKVHACWETSADALGDSGEEVKDFSCEDGETMKLSLSGNVLVKVEDSGAGLSSEQLSQLFTDGTQFNVGELQAGQGSGIGLYITKGLVQQHGGTVVATSEGLGQGSIFTMTLPVYSSLDKSGGDVEEGNVHKDNTASNYDESGAFEDTHPLRTVLIVDDVLSNRKLLARLLSKNGYDCEQAVDGVDCLDQVAAAGNEGREFDLILLDFEMPRMNGPICAKKLRAAGCSSLIVGLTGNCLPEDVAHFRSNGADDVLPKPFSLTSLQDIWAKHGIRRGK